MAAADKTFDFIRLHPERNAGVLGTPKSGEVYQLLPPDAIRGKLHIIRIDEVVAVLL